MTLSHPPFKPLTKQAVAELLEVSVRTVEIWIDEGILPAPAKLGSRVFWHPERFFGGLSKSLLEQPTEAQPQPSPVTHSRRELSRVSAQDDLQIRTERKLARLQADD